MDSTAAKTSTTNIALLGRASHLDRFESLSSILQQNHHIHATPVIYRDDNTVKEIEDALTDPLNAYNGVMCWVDPVSPNAIGKYESRACSGLEDGGLDEMLRRVSKQGIHVSAHPDIIQKMGTKRVLFDTRNEAWGLGNTTRYYKTKNDLSENLWKSLLADPNRCRVLKMERGSSGKGVWRVDVTSSAEDKHVVLRVQHAGDDVVEEGISIESFLDRLEERMSATGGGIVDMAFLPRVSEGVVRCYMFGDRCGGILHQLPFPASEHPNLNVSLSGQYKTEGLQERLKFQKLNLTEGFKVHPPTSPQYEDLVKILEEEWVPRLLKVVGLIDAENATNSTVNNILPVIWDIDFIHRSSSENKDSEVPKYALCEINCSSVFSRELIDEMAKEIAKWLNN